MDQFTGEGTPATQGGLQSALDALSTPPENLWAVLAVETSGCGFLSDKRPKILFERHIFHRLTNGIYDADDPDVSSPTAGGYGPGGSNQYLRLQAAMALNAQAALKSASWGLGQIMGGNFADAGYDDVQSMVDDFVLSEDAQLVGMAKFILKSGMASALSSKQWTTFARLYNGPNYAASNYDGNLSVHCSHFENFGCPDVVIRACQIELNYNGYLTDGIDGIAGPISTAAASSFQTDNRLAVNGVLDEALFATLVQE